MKNTESPLISIVIPCHNEETNIKWFFDSLNTELLKIKNYRFEYIFVDDGSSDKTIEQIKALANRYNEIKYLSFSRNFGKEAATTAGIENSHGDAVIMIDSDGQHPNEMIKTFISKWEKGFMVVIGVRATNEKEGPIKKYGSIIFYKIINLVSANKIVASSTDFRLIDKKVVYEFLKLKEHNRMTRNLIDWLGYSKTYISFSSSARHSGKASYTYTKLIKLAIDGLIANTTKPLQLAGVLGLLVTISAAMLGIFVVAEKYIFKDALNLHISGTAILGLFISFLVGILLICQGLLSLYVESVYIETKNRPLFIIAEKKL